MLCRKLLSYIVCAFFSLFTNFMEERKNRPPETISSLEDKLKDGASSSRARTKLDEVKEIIAKREKSTKFSAKNLMDNISTSIDE